MLPYYNIYGTKIVFKCERIFMSVQINASNKKINLRDFKKYLPPHSPVMKWMTCYDYQTAQMLNETAVDALLVGDSLGNVILGYQTTLPVKIDDMILFSKAVRKGAPDKFLVVDMPFGSYPSLSVGTENAIKVLQETEAEAIKIEGHSSFHKELITHLKAIGIPVVAHIGLTPQFIHQMGGYYTHGKDSESAEKILKQAHSLEKAGACALVLECVVPALATQITEELNIPTIGIGSGAATNGQILVINDLLGLGKNPPPKFCTPLDNLYARKKELLERYFSELERG
jgi:3-methyl-2-oxobutanoate hydroxymethyltransferase